MDRNADGTDLEGLHGFFLQGVEVGKEFKEFLIAFATYFAALLTRELIDSM
jgi:hypothetical protein